MSIQEKKLTPDDILKALDAIYDKCKNGIGKVSPPVSKMADDYLRKNKNVEKAAKSMLKNQLVKCTTSGFLTGFGGIITMPVTIPANISSVLYVQMRMIACTAYMSGMDLNSDQVQTLIYACLAGVSVNQIVKKFGVQFGKKLAQKGIEKIPGKALVKINQKVGFRLITKFGEKGLINLGKTIPLVGAIIGGGMDFAETKVIANRSYKMFIEGSFDSDEDNTNDSIIDVEFDIIQETNNNASSDNTK